MQVLAAPLTPFRGPWGQEGLSGEPGSPEQPRFAFLGPLQGVGRPLRTSEAGSTLKVMEGS